MSNIDQTIDIADATCASLSLGRFWYRLEEAAKTLDLSGFSQMRKLGGALGAVLFPPGSKTTEQLVENLTLAQQEHRVLRLSFVGQAARLPVEFTTLPDAVLKQCRSEQIVLTDAALGLHPNIELIRMMGDLEEQGNRVVATESDPLRVLIAVADPGKGRWSRVDRARRQCELLRSTCLTVGGTFVRATLLEHCSRHALEKAISATRPQVLHFLGHGAEDVDDVQAPSLVLETENGAAVDFLCARELLEICRGGGEGYIPNVVTLNACHIGRTDPTAAGFAETLSSAGVPMVAAMQLPVLDTIAEHIAEYVYRPLLQGVPLSTALAHVRRQLAIDERLRYTPVWATPVLYSRVSDTVPFAGIPRVSFSQSRSRASALGFTGREWLWQRVKRHVEHPDADVCLLEAEGGMGKSSFIEFGHRQLEAEVGQSTDAGRRDTLLLVYRYHYSEQADGSACALELSRQVRQWLETRGKPVPEERPLRQGEPQYRHACESLDDLLRAASRHTNIILFVDALDEASEASQALPVAEQLGGLPNRLSVFVTARPEWYRRWCKIYPSGTSTDDATGDPRFTVVRLEPLGEDNLRDVARFLHRSFQPFAIGVSETSCVALARTINGSFLVADVLCSLLDSRMTVARLKHLFSKASSVSGVYELVFRSVDAALVADDKAARKLRDAEDLLGLLACAREPIAQTQLSHLFGSLRSEQDATSDELAHALSYLRPYLSSDMTEHGETRFAPYHPSLRTYAYRRLGIALGDSPRKRDDSDRRGHAGYNEREVLDPGRSTARALPRPAREYQELWAHYCLEWRKLELYPRIYALRNLVPHLGALDGDESAAKIDAALTDYAFIAAALGADPSKRERPLQINELIAQYEFAERRLTRNS